MGENLREPTHFVPKPYPLPQAHPQPQPRPEETPEPKQNRAQSTPPKQFCGEDEALLKKQYYAVVHLGDKLYLEGRHELAVEKQTEIIALALKIPSAQGDLIPLYNNRSEMYEKLGLFENSMQDINMVLRKDPLNEKANQRRVRLEMLNQTQKTPTGLKASVPSRTQTNPKSQAPAQKDETGMKSDLNSSVDDGDWIALGTCVREHCHREKITVDGCINAFAHRTEFTQKDNNLKGRLIQLIEEKNLFRSDPPLPKWAYDKYLKLKPTVTVHEKRSQAKRKEEKREAKKNKKA
eukprot:gene9738-10578_t